MQLTKYYGEAKCSNIDTNSGWFLVRYRKKVNKRAGSGWVKCVPLKPLEQKKIGKMDIIKVLPIRWPMDVD